jgi:hypothetical protein
LFVDLSTIFSNGQDGRYQGCENGREAITVARQTHPSLIVLDLAAGLGWIATGKILKDVLPDVPLILFSLQGHLLSDDQLRGAGTVADVIFPALPSPDNATCLSQGRYSLID